MMDLTKGVGRYDLSQFKGPSAISQGGATMRGAFTGLGEKVMGAIAEPGLKREADAKTAKIQELVNSYNSKSDPKFQNPIQSVNALNLSNVLRPLDPALSASWLKRSEELEQQEIYGGRELEQTKARESGLTARTIEEQKTKREESAGKKAQQDLAMQKVNEVSDLWSANKEDQALQNMLVRSLNDAKLVGLNVPNPIETWIRNKTAGEGTENREKQLEMQRQATEFNQEMARQNSKRDDAKLQLDRERMAREAKAEAEKIKNSSAGSALDSTSIKDLSSLQTVLNSIQEIKSAFDDFKNAQSIGDKYSAIRDLKGSALLGSENLGRVQSGGAIQAQEMATFKSLMAPGSIDFIDGGQSYLNNVNKLESAIKNKMANFATRGKSLTGGASVQQPSANPKKIVNGREIE